MGARGSAWIGRRGMRRVSQSSCLVVNCRRDLAQPVGVLSSMVSAEQQFATAAQRHADVGLGCAAIATISGSQGLARRNCCGHDMALLRWFVLLLFQHQSTANASPSRPQPPSQSGVRYLTLRCSMTLSGVEMALFVSVNVRRVDCSVPFPHSSARIPDW